MSFNWRGATAGLLAEGGRLMGNQAARMDELEERKLSESIANRKEMAKLKREDSLREMGYDESGRKWNQGEIDAAMQAGEDVPERLYGKGLVRPTSKDPKEEKPIGYDENGNPVYKGDESKKLYKEQLGRDKKEEVKPEYKPGKALKEIAAIDKAIGQLNAGKVINDTDMESLLKTMPSLAAFMGGNKEMSKEDKAKVITSMTDYRDHLQQFKPKKYKKTAKKKTGEGRKPLSSFSRK